MSVSDRMKEFRDPLMDSVSGSRNKARIRGDSDPVASRRGGSTFRIVVAILVAGTMALFGYLFYQSQQQIRELNLSLLSSQESLASVSQKLDESQQQIGQLHEGLNESTVQLKSQRRELGRYQQLYQDLKTNQTDQEKELDAISLRKADQSQIDRIRDETAGIQSQVSQIDTRMVQVNSNVSELRELSTRNRQEIEEQGSSLATLKSGVDSNRHEIADVRRSLDREYYNFELQKDGAIIKVFNVALSLKKTDFKNQRFTLEILSGVQKITKKAQSVNEPIFFYIDGVKKPYEVLVNKVDKKFVVGYLSVPKG